MGPDTGHIHMGPATKCAAPVLIPTLVRLGIAGSAAHGTAALVMGCQQYKYLSEQVDKDLAQLHSVTFFLENQGDSLAKVVLQNQSALNLLFLKEGRLCVALREQDRLYVNHSRVIWDTLARIRSYLLDREQQRNQ